MRCPSCGHEFEAAVQSAAMAPAPQAGEEWLTGVLGGNSDAQVKHFKDLGYEMLGRTVADSHEGERYDGQGPVAYLGDGPERCVACLREGGLGQWCVFLVYWDFPWHEYWRFSVRKMPQSPEAAAAK